MKIDANDLLCVLFPQQPDESLGMNVAGGVGGSEGGDLPIYISDLRPDSVVGRCSQIQVRIADSIPVLPS